ncbi:MAG TPA: RagB/SusD family nutrient uptake outer membrane protein [Daejeonella sp.]|nr:RagB/SusD family nutrient uptake outer membrane protein [Daejeonella sp.]
MKKNILLVFLCSLLFLGCKKDLLEKMPLDKLSDDTYWTSESNVRTFAWSFYPRYFPGYAVGFDLTWGGFFTGESLNDDVASSSRFTQQTPTSSSTWSGTFPWIRKSNLYIDRIKTVPMPQEAKNHWTGVAKFFRGMEYANRVSDFGDFPWYGKVLTENDPDLYKPRDPRTLVMDSVLNDFKYAAENVRIKDGDKSIINRYAVLAMMSRIFLFEGTWQKYHNGNTAKSKEYLEASKWAANEIITKGGFSVAPDYRAIFTSLDLSSNPEVILFRRYETGILTHSLASYNNLEAQTGYTKDAIDTYLGKDGLPIKLSAVYQGDKTIKDVMSNRDPRINKTFVDELRITGHVSNYSTTGYSAHKFLNDAIKSQSNGLSQNNDTDAPQIRYAEVLLNYAEATAELGTLTQNDLDISINKLRNRADIKMPALQVIGGMPGVNNKVYDDPDRDPTVPSLIWEIRRERRVELIMEGFRLNDLRRWKKLEYVDQVQRKNTNRGAWIKRSDFPKATSVMIEGGAAEGYIIPLQSAATWRLFDNPRVYLSPIGPDQIKLYKDQGVELTQNPGW